MDESMECTGIFRMKKTYDEFMCQPGKDTSRDKSFISDRLRFADEPERKKARFNHSSKSTTSLSMAKLLEQEQADRVKDAELIKAKARISQLEGDIVQLRTGQNKHHIELEAQLSQMRIEKENCERRLDDMKTKLMFLAKSEEELKTEVSQNRKSYNALKHEYEQKLLSQQNDKFAMETRYQQREEQDHEALSRLRTDKCRAEAELSICRSELDEEKERCSSLQRKVSELLADKNELETLRIKAMNAEQKAGDLQRELDTYHDDSVMVRAMREKISSHSSLDRENRRLKDQVAQLKHNQENSFLKDEEIHSLTKQVEHIDSVREELGRVQVENENLKKKLIEWELATGSNKPHSMTDYTREISELQSQIALMLEKQGQLQASLHLCEQQKQNAVDDLNVYKSRLANETGKHGDMDDYVRRLRKRMLLLTKERDGYRKTLDSLEGEMTVNINTSRVQILEDTIKDHVQHIDGLETSLRKKDDEIDSLRQKTMLTVSPPQPREEDQELIKKLQTRVEELELYLEHRNLKGDYDPTKTKVLHLRLNPASVAQQEKAQTVEKLTEENEKLRQVIQVLKERQGEGHDLSEIVGVKVQDQPGTSKEFEQCKNCKELKSQLSSAELKNKRLMEMFQKTSREYREIYYMLTGYKVTISNHSVKVMSMYSEGPDDFLMFQYRDNTLNLMENSYTASLTELTQQYLLSHGSIPGFLGALTLNLLSKQTIIL